MRPRLRSAIAVASLLWLAGCAQTAGFDSYADAPAAGPSVVMANAGPPPGEAPPPADQSVELLGNDQHDDLSLGKKQFRARDYGLAERYFRRAVEMSPRDAEAWIGLAASYDRLKRFDESDRAYKQALAIMGPTPEILNNQGYSYMLRGDYRRAREKFYAARVKDPENPRIQKNIELMEASLREGKGFNSQ